MFEKIKNYYDKGLWSMALVRMAVRKGYISAEQFTTITNETY